MSENEQTGLDAYTEKYAAAYAAHYQTYVLRYPEPQPQPFTEPVPQEPGRKIENILSLIQMVLLLAADLIVSGSRTIAEFGRVGGAAFVMLELGLITYSYIHTSRGGYDEQKDRNIRTWLFVGILMAFAVLLLANVDNVITEYRVHHPDWEFVMPAWVDLMIQMGVAISAPVLAFIGGHVLGMYAVMQRHSRRLDLDKHASSVELWKAAKGEHDEAQRAIHEQWVKDLNDSFNRVKKSMGVQLENSVKKPVSPTFHETVHETRSTPKPRVKLHEVAALVKANGDQHLGAEEMSEKYQIAIGSTTKIREILKAQNGNGGQ